MISNITPSGNNIKGILKNFKECEEYYILSENNVYKFIIGKLDNNLIIKYKIYEITFNNKDLEILTKTLLNTIDDAYQFIINLFEYNKVIIKNIKINKSIIILLKINIYNIEKDVEITLNYNKENNYLNSNILNDEYNKLNKEINNIKDEIKKLMKNIEQIKNNNDKIENNNLLKKNNNEDNSNPKDIIFLNNIVNDSYSDLWLND